MHAREGVIVHSIMDDYFVKPQPLLCHGLELGSVFAMHLDDDLLSDAAR